MMMDAKKLSAAIRMKKKKMMDADPELVDTDSRPDLNPQDMYNVQQQGRIEATLDVPPKINAEDTMMDQSEGDAMTIGLTDEEKARMGRLRKYMDTLDI